MTSNLRKQQMVGGQACKEDIAAILAMDLPAPNLPLCRWHMYVNAPDSHLSLDTPRACHPQGPSG